MKHFSEISAMAERVVDAAEGLVQRRGYNGFSYDDVAIIVGIKKPSIHHHFPTKAELVAVVAQRYTHRFRTALLEVEGRHAKSFDHANSSLISVLLMKVVPDIGSTYSKARPEGVPATFFVQSIPSAE